MSKRDEILAAAQALFAEYGYAGTTMRMIAERAGVAFGLVSHYFGNKEKLFLVAGHEMIDAMLLGIRRDTEAAQNGLQAVDIFVNSYLSYTLANRATFPTLIRCSPFSDDNPHLDRHKIGAKFKELIREIEINLERGIADGTIAQVPVEDCALMIYAAMVGAVRTVFLSPFGEPGLFEETRRFILRSLRRSD
ncbi:transcriptional regulator, TetR family [Desulfomicrobium apsheronum]|uniref:Transcriptional regulator, TetR family n=1 Tax=Desulfomicrobium apsheronum TaxID=52560 RepID=A0A1I3QNL9_9BACT|nr:TetR/AcrR family transcriptional regulator [Desulfomicrobium apsheronum]MDY0225216.1 TetR/AcrR family transcriptional regulator [Desulfomicrobium apsheronum]SFJ35693.1 transcriptional regulator, TetR family [Desulfomicrobium apsheronum]